MGAAHSSSFEHVSAGPTSSVGITRAYTPFAAFCALYKQVGSIDMRPQLRNELLDDEASREDISTIQFEGLKPDQRKRMYEQIQSVSSVYNWRTLIEQWEFKDGE